MKDICSACGQKKEIDISVPGPVMCSQCREKIRKDARNAFILALTEKYACSCGCSGAIAELTGLIWDLQQQLKN